MKFVAEVYAGIHLPSSDDWAQYPIQLIPVTVVGKG